MPGLRVDRGDNRGGSVTAPTPMTTDVVDLAERFADRRILILGAAGFVGRWLGRTLTSLGIRPMLAVRRAADAAAVFDRYDVRGEVIAGDLTAPGALASLVSAVRPDVTFNLIAFGTRPDHRDEAIATRLNVELPAELAEIVAHMPAGSWQGARLVHVGTAQEYGTATGDLVETTEPQPNCLYGRSKLAGTRAVQAICAAHAMRGLTARLFLVYGPGEPEHRLLTSLFRAAATGESLTLSAGEQTKDFVFVADVAEALLRLAAADVQPGEAVNVATGRLTPVLDFARTAARTIGLPGDRLHFGQREVRADEMWHAPVAVGRLRATTGWLPSTTIEEGLRATAAFWQA
jgi:nucleoside-diphosphate-sugar epimerase